jgi:hypothetical protein
LTDLEARRQINLAGNGFAGLPLTRLQAAQNEYLDLLVQGAEGGRGQGA